MDPAQDRALPRGAVNNLTPGKQRGLDTLATAAGVFAILAMDHRDSLRAVIPGEPSNDDLTQFKLELLRIAGSEASGVMLEPEFSLPQAITSGALPGATGFTAALEAQGYLGDPWASPTTMQEGWSAADAKAMGASAAKLLLAFNPNRPEHAQQQIAVVEQVAANCQELDLALLVEPVAFGMDNDARTEIVLDAVNNLTNRGIDILKLEFPGDLSRPDTWAQSCAAITESATVPWVLLSSGVPYADYRSQLEVAFANGCSGFTGGRAIWGEAAVANAADRAIIMQDVVAPRVTELRHLAGATATPWRTV